MTADAERGCKPHNLIHCSQCEDDAVVARLRAQVTELQRANTDYVERYRVERAVVHQAKTDLIEAFVAEDGRPKFYQQVPLGEVIKAAIDHHQFHHETVDGDRLQRFKGVCRERDEARARVAELEKLTTSALLEHPLDTQAALKDLRGERDNLRAAFERAKAGFAVMKHIHECSQCAGPGDGCEGGQSFVFRCVVTLMFDPYAADAVKQLEDMGGDEATPAQFGAGGISSDSSSPPTMNKL